MGYYLHLAKQYMWHNKARTLYSVLGIALTFILSFCILTAGYSFWDYAFYSVYSTDPYELFSISDNTPYTKEMAEALKRMADDPAIEELRIVVLDMDYPSYYRRVLPSQIKADERYDFKIKLKDTKNLRKSAADLGQKYGMEIGVMGYVEKYLRQDESVETALINFLLTFGATVFGLFSVVILRNTMMIAVTERSRDYGLLRCVGMSERQNLILLLTEGMIMSLMASVIGLGVGYEMLKLIEPWLIKMLDLMDVFAFHFYPSAALYTTLLCIGVTLFSLVEPARLSSQVSPLEALRGALAKELTVGKAIKLLALRLTKKKKKKEKISMAEKLFGVSGFYAHRNAKRGRGSTKAVFIAIFISALMLLTVLSFTESLKATMRKHMGGTADEYREFVYKGNIRVDAEVYDPEWNEHLKSVLDGRANVTDTFSVMYMHFHYTINSSPYFYNDELKRLCEKGHGPVSSVFEMGCNAEDMEKERPYLIEGDIDYEKMVSENGVLLCDISPALRSEGRKTSYHAGDAIEILSMEGAAKARQIYMDAVAAVSERLGVGAWWDETGKVVYFVNGVEKKTERLTDPNDEKKKLPVLYSYRRNEGDAQDYERMLDEMLSELQSKGYDCSKRLPENNYNIKQILECLRELMFEEGYREKLKVSGVLSEEVYTQGSLDSYRVNNEQKSSYIRVIYPVETLISRLDKLAAADKLEPKKNGYTFSYSSGDLGFFVYRCETGIKRDMDILDNAILNFTQENDLGYNNRYSNDYFEMANALNVVTLAALIVAVFIMLVCIFQLLNTLQADMRIRKKELRLYDVVGMDPAQKFKMMLIEHGFGAAFAAITGSAASFLISFTVIKRFIILQAGADYVFKWPVGAAVLICILISGTVATANYAEWKRSI